MTEETAGTGAAGAYRYLLNGEAAAVSETWAREDLPAGGQRITSRRSAPGVEIAVDAVVGEGRVALRRVQRDRTRGCVRNVVIETWMGRYFPGYPFPDRSRELRVAGRARIAAHDRPPDRHPSS